MRVIVCVVVMLGLAAPSHADGSGAPTAPLASDDKIERARKAALSDDYQKQLPRYERDEVDAQLGTRDGSAGSGAVRPRANPNRRGTGNVSGGDRIDTREQKREPQQMNGLMQIVMWGLLIVVAVLFAVWIASELTKYGGDAEVPADESQVRMQAAVDAIIDKPLGDADELARRGEYAEAIHTLLLRTLQELVRSSAVRVAPAMTSREILARVPLLADAREALAGLITAVEITHFGDEPANAADYQRCREQFNVFAQALRTSVKPRGAQQEAVAA